MASNSNIIANAPLILGEIFVCVQMHRTDDNDQWSRHSLFWADDYLQELNQAHRAPGFVLVLRPDVRHHHIKKKNKTNFKCLTIAVCSEKLGSLKY